MLDGSLDEFGELENGIHPKTLHVDRVIAQKTSLKGYQYLTKWCDLPYSESTWEPEADLKGDKVGGASQELVHMRSEWRRSLAQLLKPFDAL